eukprot:2524172-Lingulodinium_polyedra.AAC.1
MVVEVPEERAGEEDGGQVAVAERGNLAEVGRPVGLADAFDRERAALAVELGAPSVVREVSEPPL